MKTVTVVIPTYNEEENVNFAYERVVKVFESLPYHFEILYIDNFSADHTRTAIKALCQKDSKVKAIFNAKNFGFSKSSYYGLTQATGDCAVLLFADMQDPPEMIPSFLEKWENGYKIVVGIKNKSKENRLLYFIRGRYYRLIDRISDVTHIRQFTGFGLYDKSFVEILRKLDDPMPYLRGIVAELGPKCAEVHYEQNIRERGKSHFKFMQLYDVAMLGITSYSKSFLRAATAVGFILSVLSAIIAIVSLLIKLFAWNYYPLGTAAIIIGVFLLGGLQLFFMGILGEYLMNVNIRVMHRPLVIEEERLNFDVPLDMDANDGGTSANG